MKFITRTEATLKNSENRLQSTEAMLRNQQASIQNLENQVGRMATFLVERPQGSLPSNTKANPKRQVKAIKRVREEEEKDGEETAIAEPREEVAEEQKKEEVKEFSQEKKKKIGTNVKENGKGKGATMMEEEVHEEVKDEDTSEEDDEEMVEAPPRNSRMTKPSYVQHIKVFIKKKKSKLNDTSFMELAKENTPPPKQEDPGSFAIPCKIDNISTCALVDLGSGVNLLPYSMFEKANIGKLQPTNISIELTDAMVKPVKGIIRDVPIHTHNFTIMADFIVMDMEVTDSFPVILERPSLATCEAIIDVKGGTITLGAGKEDITFYASNHPLYPSHSHMKKKSMGREEEKAEAHHEEDNLADTLHDKEEEEEPMEESIMEENIEPNRNQGDEVLHKHTKEEKEYHAPRIKLGDEVLYYKVKVNP